jgi:hypothetical protein
MTIKTFQIGFHKFDNAPNLFTMNTIAMFENVATPLGRSVRMTLTLPKWGLGSPPRLPKTQNSIIGVKTPCLEVFFIPLERS